MGIPAHGCWTLAGENVRGWEAAVMMCWEIRRGLLGQRTKCVGEVEQGISPLKRHYDIVTQMYQKNFKRVVNYWQLVIFRTRQLSFSLFCCKSNTENKQLRVLSKFTFDPHPPTQYDAAHTKINLIIALNELYYHLFISWSKHTLS